MKKMCRPYKAAAAAVLAAAVTAGCGQGQPKESVAQTAEETAVSASSHPAEVHRPNPMAAVTDETAFQSLGIYMAIPKEAEEPLCFILNGEVAEIQFDYDGIPYSYRASNTAEDFAGIFERFTEQFLTAEYIRAEGEETVSVKAQIRTTQSGGRLASWSWEDTDYTLYTAANVTDEEITAVVTRLLELICQQ